MPIFSQTTIFLAFFFENTKINIYLYFSQLFQNPLNHTFRLKNLGKPPKSILSFHIRNPRSPSPHLSPKMRVQNSSANSSICPKRPKQFFSAPFKRMVLRMRLFSSQSFLPLFSAEAPAGALHRLIANWRFLSFSRQIG